LRSIGRTWKPYSRLILVDDSPLWVLAWEMRELAAIARRMGVRIAAPKWMNLSERQALFFASQFIVLTADVWPGRNHAVGTAYFHGKPGTGVPEFDACYARLCQMHPVIQRIQVSHTEMRDIILESGIAPEKVFLIPIGINLSFWFRRPPGGRARLPIPSCGRVLSKDGGLGEAGAELIKGRMFSPLNSAKTPELMPLSGPPGGYVKAG
jgi:hypothetical protein